MSIVSWLRKPKPSAMAERRRIPAAPRQRATFRPQLEALEDRWMPSILTVTSTADQGPGYAVPGMLRYEIGRAQSGDTIVFDKSLRGQTITLTYSELYIDKSLTIQGLGANYLAISGGNQFRVFDVAPYVQVTLSGMTIEKGTGFPCSSCGFGGGGGVFDGGGILNYGTLTLSDCTVSGNGAGSSNGGGIANELGGTLTITGCTVSGNLAGSIYSYPKTGGGGIYNDGTMTLSGSTVTNNSAPVGGLGAGIFNDVSGVLTILSSTVIHNHLLSGGVVDLYNLGTWSADSSSTIGKIA